MNSIFSEDAINKAVSDVEAREGRTLDLGVEAVPGEKPALTVEAQGGNEHVTWAAYVRSQFSKATTAAGAKLGIRW